MLGMDRDPVPTCKMFARSVVVLFLSLYRVFKSMELLFFDSHAETDIVRRFPTSEKVSMSTSGVSQTRCLSLNFF